MTLVTSLLLSCNFSDRKDSTLTFAARRQIPTRYNRELAATTLRAMERISEIRARRERAFYKNRMAGNKERALAAAKKLIEMDEKYKMFAEKDTVDEEDMMQPLGSGSGH